MLNLGCGHRFHGEWVNIDFFSRNKRVLQHDLKKGIPSPDNTFEVVYHSHVLEHFPADDAGKFIRECYRVLKPGGILRVAVPDLEQIARNYLTFLDGALTGDPYAEANYDWTMLELFDQCVRQSSGGNMERCLRNPEAINKDFIRQRIGYFYDLMNQARPAQKKTHPWKKLKQIMLVYFIRNLCRSAWNQMPGAQYRTLGQFRLSGEVHQWMYDRFSLPRLLRQAGFQRVTRQTAHTSAIPGWPQYRLDTEPNGAVYKPDSLFMEATKL